jgi:hypothetical protein
VPRPTFVSKPEGDCWLETYIVHHGVGKIHRVDPKFASWPSGLSEILGQPREFQVLAPR